MDKTAILATLFLLMAACAPVTPSRRGNIVTPSPAQTVQPVAILVEQSRPALCVTADALTIRSKPNYLSQPVSWLYKGDALTVVESRGYWLRISSSQYQGWVNSKYTGSCHGN